MRILTYLITLVFLLVACKKEHTFYGHLYDAPAYDFELTSQDGKRVKLSDYLREKK
jgi:protein SCO1/2